MLHLLLLDGRGAGGGGNGGGVVFLLCLDLGLSPLFVTFLPRLPDDDLFLFLSTLGDVAGTVGIGFGLGCWIYFSLAYIWCPTYTSLMLLFSFRTVHPHHI